MGAGDREQRQRGRQRTDEEVPRSRGINRASIRGSRIPNVADIEQDLRTQNTSERWAALIESGVNPSDYGYDEKRRKTAAYTGFKLAKSEASSARDQLAKDRESRMAYYARINGRTPAAAGPTPPATNGQTPPATNGQTPPAKDGQTPPAKDGQTPPANNSIPTPSVPNLTDQEKILYEKFFGRPWSDKPWELGSTGGKPATNGPTSATGSRDMGPVIVSPDGTITKKDPKDPNKYYYDEESGIVGTLMERNRSPQGSTGGKPATTGQTPPATTGIPRLLQRLSATELAPARSRYRDQLDRATAENEEASTRMAAKAERSAMTDRVMKGGSAALLDEIRRVSGRPTRLQMEALRTGPPAPQTGETLEQLRQSLAPFRSSTQSLLRKPRPQNPADQEGYHNLPPAVLRNDRPSPTPAPAPTGTTPGPAIPAATTPRSTRQLNVRFIGNEPTPATMTPEERIRLMEEGKRKLYQSSSIPWWLEGTAAGSVLRGLQRPL